AGVPLVALLGAFGGWRVAIAVQAGTMLVAAVAVWLSVPGRRPAPSAVDRSRASFRRLMGTRILTLLLASTMERTCFAAVAVYLSAVLLETYGIPMPSLAPAPPLGALGNLGGDGLGGGRAGRGGGRPLVVAGPSIGT